MIDLPRTTADGMHSIMLSRATAHILVHLLNPQVPFVWVIRHLPGPGLEWWKCMVPLAPTAMPTLVEVRGLQFDFVMQTSEFLTRLFDFDGLTLYQMNRKVPYSLTLDGVSNQDRIRILKDNGLSASFHLPHAMESASFATVDRATIEKALANETVRELAY